MPNHIATHLRITGPSGPLASFLAAITPKPSAAKGKDRGETTYSFDSLFPCPEELLDVTSPVTIVSEEEFQKQRADQLARKARIAAGEEEAPSFGLSICISKSYQKDLIHRFGADNWYDWCTKNWSTKWGLYDVKKLDSPAAELRFSFNTAWSPARGFWRHVSALYPDLEFFTEFADEGGWFVGTETFHGGQMTDYQEFDWESADGIEVREKVHYGPSDEEEDEEDEEVQIEGA